MREIIRFGGLRGARGYFSATVPRAGPGVVILDDSGSDDAIALADRLTSDERLTVLVPEITNGWLRNGSVAPTPPPILRDAVDHLRDNWHPRVGLMGFGSGAPEAMRHARVLGVDAVVLHGGWAEVDPASWRLPLLVHLRTSDERSDERRAARFLEELGAEVYLGGDTPSSAAALAGAVWERNVEFLRYHLS